MFTPKDLNTISSTDINILKMHKTIITKGIGSDRAVFILVPSGSDYKDKVLAYLARTIGKKVTANSIKKDLHLSYGYLHSTTSNLCKSKIMNIEEVGNYNLISLNLKNMLAIAEVSRISVRISQEVTNKDKRLRKINELVEDLRKYKGILSIVLFGSHAKLMAHEHSDIDLLVIIGPKYQKSRTLINNIKIDIISFGTKEFLDIQSFIVDYGIFKNMLESKEEINVGKEAFKDCIILDGFENYWKMVGEIIG